MNVHQNFLLSIRCIGYEPDVDNQLCSAITSENVALAFIKYR